jgi:trk system potassium uptake protein TrkA
MKKNCVVIGLGRFGFSMAQALYDLGHDVLAVDTNEDRVGAIDPFVTHAIQTDATDENSLRSLGISNMDVAIIGMGNDIKASILVTILCKDLGVGMVISKAQDDLHGKVLSRVGADKIVFPEREMGLRLAQSITSTNILEYIDLSDEYSIAEVEVLQEWENSTLKELDLRHKYGINIVAIKSADGKVDFSLLGESVLKFEDTLVVIGAMQDIHKLKHTTKRK